MKKMRSNLHIYPSPFTHETRILKQTRTLVERGLFAPVHIGAMWHEGLTERERIDADREVWRVKLAARRLPDGPLFKAARFLEWSWRLYRGHRNTGIQVVNCHSLSTLPLGVAFKLLRGCKLVYDTHELETETDASALQRRLGKIVERRLIRFADLVTVVSGSIGEWYEREYGLESVPVIRNIPYRSAVPAKPSSVLKESCGLDDDEILFIYQGVLGPGRNVEMLLKVFACADRDKHIVFLGFGALEEVVRRAAQKHANIHFHPAVQPAEVLAVTSSADVGIHIIADTCLNHYYCLPNKVFEYLLSGLPAVLSDFPEMGQVMRETGAGWTTPVNEEAVRSLVNGITRTDVEMRRKAALANREKYCWEFEEEIMAKVYRSHLPP